MRPVFRSLGRWALPALLLCALPASAHAAPAALSAEAMAPRVQACTICHGKEGRSTPEGYFPRIAGKPAGYLANQMLHFREGRRSYPQMTSLIEHLTDDYLREMAAYFAALDLPYPPPARLGVDAAVLDRGRNLVHRGDPARQIPACVQCHGGAMTGVTPSIPGLLGLPRDYLNSQLGAWATGQRRSHVPDCMADIARRLTAEEVSAISAWLASQPVPDRGHPADALPAPLPLRCGGVEGVRTAGARP